MAENITDQQHVEHNGCLLYTSDAADERSSVDLGGRRHIKKKKTKTHCRSAHNPKRPVHDII